MLTNVAKGIELCFVCRAPNCGYYGRNDQWIKHREREWFRCPTCGAHYKPGSTAQGQVERLNFVLVIPDPVTGVLQSIPCEWPATQEMAWLNRQIEIEARQVTTEEDVQKWHDRTQLDLVTLINNERISTAFRSFVPDLNLAYRVPDGQWQWAEYAARTCYYGAILAEGAVSPDKPPFSQWPVLSAAIANHVASGRARTSRL